MTGRRKKGNAFHVGVLARASAVESSSAEAAQSPAALILFVCVCEPTSVRRSRKQLTPSLHLSSLSLFHHLFSFPLYSHSLPHVCVCACMRVKKDVRSLPLRPFVLLFVSSVLSCAPRDGEALLSLSPPQLLRTRASHSLSHRIALMCSRTVLL